MYMFFKQKALKNPNNNINNSDIDLPINEILFEYKTHQTSRCAGYARFITFTFLLITWSAALVRMNIYSNQKHNHANNNVECWSYTYSEYDVLYLIAESGQKKITLIDASNPGKIWPRRELAKMRARASALIWSLWLQNKFPYKTQGSNIRSIVTALAEYWLHLKFTSPIAIIVSNQYSCRQKALLLSCNYKQIRSTYVQHANIGGYEGPIITTCALLNSLDSAEKYSNQGPLPDETVIIGSVKVDAVIHRKSLHYITPSLIGLCPDYNASPKVIIEKWAELISGHAAAECVLRPHPNDPRRRTWHKVASGRKIMISDSRTERLDSFLARVGGVVTGDSHLLVEALAAGLPVWQYESVHMSDQYGFLRGGLSSRGIVEPIKGGEPTKELWGKFLHVPISVPVGLAEWVASAGSKSVFQITFGKLEKVHLSGSRSVWVLA